MNSEWTFASPVRTMSIIDDFGFEKKSNNVNIADQSKLSLSPAAWNRTPTTKVY